MYRRLFFLLIPLTMLACSTVNRLFSATPPGEQDVEEQAVYSVLFSDHQGQNVVLSSTTNSGFEFSGQSDMPQGMNGLSQDLWARYLDRNDRSYPLSNTMDLGVEYTLMDAEEMADIFTNSENGWEDFYSRYPDSPGITTLSKVGFSRDGTEALVYMGTQFHYLAGSGNLIRLEKQDGVWKIMEEMMLWIS